MVHNESKKYESKNLYIAMDIDCRGMKYAYVHKMSDCYNLKGLCDDGLHGEKVISANVWPKWYAEKVVDSWNEIWKERGCFYWDHFAGYDESGDPVFDIDLQTESEAV